MFISWSGRGLLVFVIVFIIAIVIHPFVSPAKSLYWPAYTCMISGAITYWLGKKWNTYKQPLPQEGTLVETKIQYKKITMNRHKLYWIPIQYIGILLVIIGVLFLILGFKEY